MSKIEKILFFILILLLPSQLSWHFWPILESVKSDYHAITIFISDLIAVILLFFKITDPASRLRPGLLTIIRPEVFALLLLIMVNVTFSYSPLLSFYKYLQLAVFSLAMYFSFRIPLNQKIFHMAFPLSLIWISLLGLFQFFLNRSIGEWVWWLGERPLSVVAHGISTVDFSWLGVRILRPYSVFPHPNALAGFLLVGVVILVCLGNSVLFQHSSFWKYIKRLALVLSIAVIIISFSVNSLIVGIIILTIASLNSLSIKTNKAVIAGFALVCLVLAVGVHQKYRPYSFNIRVDLLYDSLSVISQHSLTGTGLGGYLFGLTDQLTASGGFYQPVHNGFLLLLAETGVPLFLMGGLVLYKFVLQSVSQKTHLLLIGPVLLSILDHYWLTSHANLFLLVIIILLSYIPTAQHESRKYPNT